MPIEIISIMRRVELSRSGDLVEVYQIRFRSEKGAYGTVTIPALDFDPEKARARVKEEAEKLDKLYEPY